MKSSQLWESERSGKGSSTRAAAFGVCFRIVISGQLRRF